MHIQNFRWKYHLMHPLMFLIIFRNLNKDKFNQTLQLFHLTLNKPFTPNWEIQNLALKFLFILTLLMILYHIPLRKPRNNLNILLQNTRRESYHILNSRRTPKNQIPIKFIKHRRNSYTLHIFYIKLSLLIFRLKRPYRHYY